MSENDTATGRGKKFPQTRQLINTALKEGMTQEEIRKECRVAQSVVSGWANGKAQAREPQLRGLIERFGHLLNRPVRDLYLVEDVEVSVKVIEEEYDEHEDRFVLGHTLNSTNRSLRFVEVMGPVIWRHTFTWAETVPRGGYKALARGPVSRWVVHRHDQELFRLVRLDRRRIRGSEFEDWHRELPDWARSGFHPSSAEPGLKVWVESVDDPARWSATIEAPMSAGELVSFAKDFVAKAPDDVSVHDRLTLVFRLVRALHGLGINVSEVERA